jgi:hypothetical protein
VDPHYFRTSDGYDADLVFRLGTVVWAIEAKLTADPSPGDFDRLIRAGEMIGADRRYLVAQVKSSTLGTKRGIVSLVDLIELIRAQAHAR